MCMVLFTLALILPAIAEDARVITFNVPDGGREQFQGTWPIAINDEGTITGFYADA